MSFPAYISSAVADSFRFSLRYDGSTNFYISNTATGWSLNGTADTISLWINPPSAKPSVLPTQVSPT